MGKGRPRAVEKGVLGQSSSYVPSSGSLNIPSGPVYHPTEEEFKDPLGFISKIRPQAEPYGICRIVPPESWKPPFALDLDSFTFPTKAQAIHQLQVRPAACDSDTFELEYNRFLEKHCGKKLQKRVVFEGQDLDLCKLFNAVKRYGGYDKVAKEKQWGEVFRLVSSSKKIPECAKHVLCQLYREHLYDYESYYNRLTANKARKCKKRMHEQKKSNQGFDLLGCKRRRRNNGTSVTVEETEEFDQICQQCNSGSHGEVMLLCDRCNKGWHMYCLSPPLKQIPPGNWYCSECMGSDKESFGFVPGKCFSLETFRRVANRTKRKWLGSALVSRVQIEKRFWEIVEGLVGEVEVMYGSDLDTSVYGSGFPRVNVERPESIEAAVWDKYCTSPWNLNNLPKLQGSMLRAVHHNIAGVMVPWLYIGMLFSSFCWHFEDHCFYSMNYLHWGEPKCWYSVPGSEANAFEKVMRTSLPDLFDAQPDLLFQLVTMLNPSVLQKNDVPVYSVLQEPGNFVITFPRSYHGGFNLGINCAEAVNFAPADWLPHGGFGAGLYQLYRKAAVLSHEELLCVVAKNECNNNVSPHLKKELLRVYAKEKSWREQLWKNGFKSSSPMSLRKNADQVGTEEDPPCIICHQYLYLSAVVCCCRPDAFACLEHWERICECKPSKHRLLYRYTLAELSDLVHLTDKYDFEETPQNRSLRRQHSCSNDSTGLTKKVKCGTVSHAQLAKEWISHSCKIVKMPFSSDTFADALKEAEQFIWAGAEMDPVRDMAARLIEAKKWAEGVKDCVSKVEGWSCKQCSDSEKIPLEHVNQLLSLNPVPCNEPLYLKLKDYVEEARLLIEEINSAVSSCSEIFELEKLHSRACALPFSLEESKKLGQRISSAKVCLDRVRACIQDGCSTTIELDILYELKAELLELQVQLPETEMLLNLLRQTELHRTRCCEILKDPISLKEVEALFQDLDDFKINFAELKLLRQYFSDVVSWKTRFHDIIMNASERHDQGKLVDELKCIFNDGATLKIQVDELHLVEVELRRAACREKALKIRDACGCKMSLELFRDLMMEADKLEIKGEKLFVDVSGVLAVAMHWEENAKHVLGSEAQMSVLEEMIRAAEGICVILPSLNEVNDAVSTAKSWLEMSKPFLASVSSTGPSSGSLLKIEELEELILQSKSLKVSLAEQKMVQTVMQNCLDWKSSAFSLLEDAESLFDLNDIDDEVANGLSSKIELFSASLIPVLDTGVSLGFDFIEIPRLQNFRSSLKWCHKALSFRCVSPSLEEVEELIMAAEDLPLPCTSSSLLNSFMDGIQWLRRASLIVSVPCSFRRCQLADAEEVSRDSEALKIKFPMMADRLVHAIERHKLWLEQVNFFFCLKHDDRSCSSLIELKDNGKADAFDCPELSRVLSEVERLEKWKLHFEAVMGPFVGDMNLLPIALAKVRDTLDGCLSIYEKSKEKKVQNVCICRSPEFDQQEFLTCLSCMSCYHLRCLGSILSVTNDTKENTCQYCRFLKSGLIPRNGRWPLKPKGNRPELKMIVELISGAVNVCVWLEEQETLQKLVAQALASTTCLMEIVDVALAYLDKDIGIVCKQLSNALQAVNMAGVYDHEAYFGLELALTRNSWKVRVDKLLEGLQKPSIQQIQKLFREGEAINMPPEDHFRKRIAEVKSVCTQWALTAKQVATDSGELELDKVFKLIKEGENLPVHFEKELKLLRARSMLYCICRKPYDQRAMIACDRCDEWYHFDCIKLSSAPKIYICPACWPLAGDELSSLPLENEDRSTDAKCGEPQMPCARGSKRMVNSSGSRPDENHSGVLNYSNGINNLLLWRNRKPFSRAAKKRVELERLTPFLRIQH